MYKNWNGDSLPITSVKLIVIVDSRMTPIVKSVKFNSKEHLFLRKHYDCKLLAVRC